jgi:hypothetical protein
MTENEIGKIVVDTGLGVHRDLGPFLLNFGEALMKRGITRAVNGLDDSQPLVGLPTWREKKNR